MAHKRHFAALLLALALVLTGCTATGTRTTESVPQIITEAAEPASTDTPETNGTLPSVASELPPPAEETADAQGADGADTSEAVTPEIAVPTCTVSISCATVLAHLDMLDAEKTELIPVDGVLLSAVEIPFTEGESAFDLLLRVCRDNKLHMEFTAAPLYGSAYIEGIGNLYEFDCGEGSGWMYRVNGAFQRFGCSQYTLCAFDTVEWVYTCDFGADVGDGGAVE